jgi:hypothetical protein
MMPPTPNKPPRRSCFPAKILLEISGLGVLLLPLYWIADYYAPEAIRNPVKDFVDQHFLLYAGIVVPSLLVFAISLIYLVMQCVLPPKWMRLGSIVLAVVVLAGLLYYAFMPLGLVWFLRTGGWDKWSKVLDGHVTDKGAVVFPVKVDWDFVDLTVTPKLSRKPLPTDEVVLRVINDRHQSISVRCGKWNKDRTGCEENMLVHELTTGVPIRVYEGSLAELNRNWTDIQIQRADGGDRVDVELVVEGKHGPYQKDAIPFTVEAKWHSYGP